MFILVVIGVFLIYICLISNFELFNQCRDSPHPFLLKFLLCCTIGKKIRDRGIQEKIKNWILFINIIIAIIITIMTEKSIADQLNSSNLT